MTFSTAYSRFWGCAFAIIFLLCGLSAGAQLTADFTTDKDGGCSPVTITFTNTSKGTTAGATYKWDFGNSNTSTLTNPGATYRDEKTYTVTLTVTSGGQTATKTKQVTVYKKPTVSFSVDKDKGCAPFGVKFTSGATAGDGTIAKYTWDFGDGNTQESASSQVSHTYNYSAKVPVSLTVTNSNGCYQTLSKTDVVDIKPGIAASFLSPKTIYCNISDVVAFTNNSTGPADVTYAWDFGDGKTATDKTPTHAYGKKGLYTVKLTVNSATGCTQTSTLTDYINIANFKSNFTVPALICQGASISVNNTSTPQPSYSSWYADGADVYYSSFSLQTPGKHTIKLTNVFGTCQESVSKEVDVVAKPALNGFILNRGDACGVPVTISFKDTSKDAKSWSWSLNSQNFSGQKEPKYTINSEGYYYVQLSTTNAAGCTATTSQSMNIYRPDIQITQLATTATGYNEGCVGTTIKFGAIPADSVVQYKWNFGDGSTSAETQPVHTFNTAGSYKVSLDFVTKSGCKDNRSYYTNIVINKKPKIDFTVNAATTCGNTPVTFTAIVPSGGTPAADYYWQFGDGQPGSYFSATVSHQYYNDTSFTVALIASNGTCRDTVTKKDVIKVLPPFPKISSATNTCAGTRGLVTFNESSQKAISGSWDFGDGSTAVKSGSPSMTTHTYARTGTYKVVVTAVNGQCSVRDSTTVYVLLKQNPMLTTTGTQACANDQIQTKIGNLEINPYPNYYYYNLPFGIQSFQYGDNTSFMGSQYLAPYQWQSKEFMATLNGLEPGKNNLQAVLYSSYFNCPDTTNVMPLKIKGPKADFDITKNNACFQKPVEFTDRSSTLNNVAIKTWDWNYGDYATATFTNGNTHTHTYVTPGAYSVSLKVTDAEGCSSRTDYSYYSKYYAYAYGPKADFSWYPSNVSPNTTVSFYNNSNTYNSYYPTYSWIMPDGSTSTDYYPNFTFNNLGVDTVKLIAKDPNTSCGDTAVKIIRVKNVNAAFTYTVSYINGNACPPVIVRFTNTSLNSTSASWRFGDGGSAENQNYPSHTYNNPGVYYITLLVDGYYGRDSTVDSITIKGPYARLKADILSGCSALNVTLNAAVRNAASFAWDFGDGTIKNTTDTFAVHEYTSPGVYIPALILKDSTGCSGTSELQDKIVLDSLSVGFSVASAHICDSSLVQFTPAIYSLASSALQQPLNYKWTFTSNLKDTSSEASPFFLYPAKGKYPASLTVRSPYGCVKTVTDSIEVFHTAKGTIAAPVEICQNKTATFAGSADVNTVKSWTWKFNNGNTSILQNPPAQSYTDSGIYIVSLIVENEGCFDTAKANLIVHQKPLVGLTPNKPVVCLGKSVELTAGGGNIFKWRRDDGLSDYSIAKTLATPTKNITYQVEVTNIYGCINTDSAIVTVAAPFQVDLAPDGFICYGKQLKLNATNASTYQWINNTETMDNPRSGSPVVSPKTPAIFTVVGYDAYNCFTDTAQVKIKVDPLPTVRASPNVDILTGTETTISAIGSSDVTRYEWLPADYLACPTCATTVSTPRRIINYVVTATTAHGCEAMDTVHVNLICDQGKVFIPNAFTPNDDQKNDVFYIKGKGVKVVTSMRIFDRYGNIVFEKGGFQIEDRSQGWNGTYRGDKVPNGAYVYFIELICDNDQPFSLKGTVMVIR